MTRTKVRNHVGAALVAAGVMTLAVGLQAEQKPAALGQVKIAKDVMANGQRLAAGTYTVRLTGEQGKSVVGQTPEESQWVEFVQGQDVKGREVATALSSAEAKKVLKGLAPSDSPAAELLKGGDYIRVRVAKGGTRYLVHLAVAK